MLYEKIITETETRKEVAFEVHLYRWERDFLIKKGIDFEGFEAVSDSKSSFVSDLLFLRKVLKDPSLSLVAETENLLRQAKDLLRSSQLELEFEIFKGKVTDLEEKFAKLEEDFHRLKNSLRKKEIV